MDDVPVIPGAAALAAWYGRWPSFHDAGIHELHLSRQGVSSLKVHIWHMTDRVDEKGFYILEKHVLVTLSMKQIGFSHQNVISELVVGLVRDAFVITLEPCYGLSGIIEAKEISVEFAPFSPSGLFT